MKIKLKKGGNCKNFVNDTKPGIKPIAMKDKTKSVDGPLKGGPRKKG